MTHSRFTITVAIVTLNPTVTPRSISTPPCFRDTENESESLTGAWSLGKITNRLQDFLGGTLRGKDAVLRRCPDEMSPKC
jgi:hypothetical protein